VLLLATASCLFGHELELARLPSVFHRTTHSFDVRVMHGVYEKLDVRAISRELSIMSPEPPPEVHGEWDELF
jgi:hypothetical protein